MSSHCGTHIEFPYHHNRHGLDAGAFPLERLIGDCLLLDFTHKRPGDAVTGEAVTLEEIKAYESEIKPGDMLLFNFNCAQFYGTPRSHDRPYLTYEAIEWLALEKKIGLIGSDASGLEKKGVPGQPGHQILMDNQIPIIESATNLHQLRRRRFTLFVLALCVVGLDACPVRLIAVEEET
jgi:arylformamidase